MKTISIKLFFILFISGLSLTLHAQYHTDIESPNDLALRLQSPSSTLGSGPVLNWKSNIGIDEYTAFMGLIPLDNTLPYRTNSMELRMPQNGRYNFFNDDVTLASNLLMTILNDGRTGIGTIDPKVLLHLHRVNDASLADGSGVFQIGESIELNLVMDRNEIMARNNGGTSPLLLQKDGGNVGVGEAFPDVRLQVGFGTDVNLNQGSGYFQLGGYIFQNLVFDQNEIQSRDNGLASTLFLQAEGGVLDIGSGGVDIANGKFEFTENINGIQRINFNGTHQNTLLGTSAGINMNQTGTGFEGMLNTIIGSFAGIQLTTGHSNTFIGQASGNINTGDRNTMIGRSAGSLNNGSDNVFIGHLAGNNESGSHKLYIDNTSTTNPLIYGEFDTNLVKVNGSMHITEFAKLEPLPSPPASPTNGTVYYNSGDDKLKVFTPSGWQNLN